VYLWWCIWIGCLLCSPINLETRLFSGNYSFWAKGTPLVTHALLQATKKVPNPSDTEVAAGRTTVYDTWMATFPSEEGYDRPE